MKTLNVLLILLFAPVAVAGTAEFSGGVEFSGEIVKSEGVMVTTGKIHVKGEKYRLEFPDPAGPTTVSIADPKADTVVVLVPRYQLYMEDKFSGRLAKMNDPFAAIASMRPHYESKVGATEKIGGYECRREDLLFGDAAAISIWQSTKLGFPLKVVMLGQKGHWTEIRKVKEGAVSADLMKVPAGFTKATRKEIAQRIAADPEMKAKREAWENAKPRQTRLGKFMRVGDQWWILLGKVTDVAIEVKYPDDAVWWVVPYRDGKQLCGIEQATVKGKGHAKLPKDGPPEMVAIGVKKGSPNIDIELTGQRPLIRATRAFSAARSGANRSWTLNRRYRKLTITFTADQVAIKGEFNLTKNGKKEKHPVVVEPGKTTTFEYTDADKVTHCDYSLPRGSGRIEILTDMRPPEEQRPFGSASRKLDAPSH